MTQPFFMIPNNTCYYFVHNNLQDTSTAFCFVVQDSSDAGTITGGGPQCGVATGTLTVSSYNGTPLGWYSSTGGPFGSLSNTTTTQTYNVAGTTYFAYLTKNGVCPIDTTIDTISITPYSNGGTITPANSSVCSGTNVTTLTALGIVGTNLGWESAPSATGPWTPLGNTTSSYAATNLSTATYYHLIADNGICPNDTSNVAVINIDQPTVGGTLAGGIYQCGPPPANGTLTLSGNTGTPVVWEFSNNMGVTWTNSGCSGTSCVYSVLSPTATVIYRVTVDNGACPSVYVYDTISVRPVSVGGTASATVDTLCAGIGGGVLSLNGQVGNNFHWEASVNGGSTWTTIPSGGATALYYNLPAATYWVHCIVQSDQCPPDTSTQVTILVNPSPSVNIVNPDDSLQPGQTITIVATGTGNPTWTLGTVTSPNSFTTTATPYTTTTYVIVTDDGSGCLATDTLHIYMTSGPFTGFISNTLTPNNDSINDAFWVENIEGYLTNSLEIFNEYGQSIYSASPYKNDWKGTYNGNRVPDGTYYYVLSVTDLGKEKKYKGFITILGGKQ
jgi:gliding motility-associated-like protein